MELIRDIGIMPIKKKDGTDGFNQMHSVFVCPRCNSEIVKPRTKGLRDKTCGSMECKKAQMIEAQSIVSKKRNKSGANIKLFKTGDLLPANKESRLHSLYRVLAGMKQRCTNDKIDSWGNYGGKGVTVCERWSDSFENFYDDMGEEYLKMKIKADGNRKLKPTIDRIDKNGNYEPGNCQWLGLSEHMTKDMTGVGVIAVEAYDPDTGKSYALYSSATEASLQPIIIMHGRNRIEKYLNVAHILACCRGTRTHTLYTHWRFTDRENQI